VTLVDTHAHLDQEEFDPDRSEVLARAAAAGVEAIVSIGIGAASSRRTVALAQAHPIVFAAVGIHPNSCHEAGPGDWDEIRGLARERKVVALGETGLDRYRDYAPFPLQQEFFDRHVRLSQETGLPFVVHARDSLPDILAMLREARSRAPLKGVMHSYTGDLETARQCLELGLYISFAGMVSFKKSQALREVAAALPADRILLETDCPYLAPEPYRGKRNEPAHVVYTAQVLARARGVSLDDLSARTSANAFRLFGLNA
jgi:TatD DNase family protein